MSTDDPIKLDQHRGMAAQKATELRRMQREIKDNEALLRQRQDELQAAMIMTPAETWEIAAEKAEYLITLLAPRANLRNPQLQKLMTAVFEDFARLSQRPPDV